MGTSSSPASRMLSTLSTLAAVPLVLATTSAMEIQPREAAIAPKERGFFRLACYSTCAAANFASSTSCTFGGFFLSTTLNCQQIFPVLSANASGRKLAPKPEERGFFRLACYSTCASSTSCTFGGLFWSTTLNCQQIFPVLSANASGRKLAPKPEERGFFRLACYSTCAAASFASTTSCTF